MTDSRTGNAVVATSLYIECDEVSADSSRWIFSEQMNSDLVSDEPIELLNGLSTETA